MANETRSGRKIKDDDSSSSKRRHIAGRGSSTSGSVTTDTSGLRRSTRETPSKKQTLVSTSSTRKSERLEKQTPPTPPVKRKSERVEKQRMPSPSRKSERSEKHRPSSSIGSKKSEKGLTFSNTKHKKEKREKNGKQQTLDAREHNRNEKQDSEPLRVILKKKRLDARSYRALLSPQPRMAKESDLDERLERRDKLSLGDSRYLEASGSKEVEEDGDECSEKRGEEPIVKVLGRDCGRAVEGSISGLGKFVEWTSRKQGEGELSQFSRKRKKCSEETHNSENGESSPVSKCSDSSRQSSPDGAVAKETVDDAKGKVQVDCPGRENMQTPELIESTSEGRSLAGDADIGEADKAFKRKRNTMDMDSDASETAVSKDICSSADAVSSSPSGNKITNCIERCVVCCKRQRMDFDPKNREFCSCKAKEVCVQVATLKSPQNDDVVVSCNQMDWGDGPTATDEPDLGASGLLPEPQRQIVHDSSNLDTGHEIPIPLEEDRGESEAQIRTKLTEECGVGTQQNKSTLILQADGDQNACVICKLGGKLLCCDGKECKMNFHLSCLDPPLKEVPPGVWHCIWCVKKKIRFGVHSVSEGVESIWDAREVDESNHEGMQRQKQYLVKYKGLAHVHNRWVPENQLLLDAPLLVAKFNRKNQCVRLKPEWKVPHRFLQKRSLMSPKQRDEYYKRYGIDFSDCHFEWFVKWSGLGYEHATWELENASFLRSTEAMKLIEEYNNRCEKAKRASSPSRADKVLQERKESFLKLVKFPGGGPPGLDNYHLSFVNKLRECWHKGQNAVVIDDQERFTKVVLFILSLQSVVCRPFLIVSTLTALSGWEAEFLRLAPSVNVVVYNGNRDVRKSIRTLEFYEEGGCIMFQVLLSHPDAIVEDLEVLECVGWEAVIVDECQRSSVSKHFEQFKMLTTDLRLLVASGQIKESLAEYLNLLSFLDSGGEGINTDCLKIDSTDNIGILKERLAQFIAFERKSDSSKFIEYWVPVRLSNVQLEQYCATLFSNSMSLRSCTKNDTVGALREIVISTRKCCDHPYLVDPSLQSLLMKGLPEVEYLDVGIKASSKLQLLDKILQEIKSRGFRVLILFQSIGGAGRISIGDILDDFLRQRFGPDSYERVDSGLLSSKKQAALSMFNKKERGRFVFLLENRACLPSIKLSSVDTVILFDSDWNPLNDLRSLQRITIDSQFEQLKVFRLYSTCTVEEKVLILAKQDVTIDSNIQNISRAASHMLLIWGASYLFSKLDEFHGCNTPASGSNISSEQPFMNDVVQELLMQLPHNAENNYMENCSIIKKVRQSAVAYSRDIYLLGESEVQLRHEEPPHVFWTKLLEGRYPQWRYLSGSSQRIRRKVQYFDDTPKKSEVETDEVIKKRKKVVNNTTDPISLRPSLEDKRKVIAAEKEGSQAGNESRSFPRSTVNVKVQSDFSTMANDFSEGSEVHTVESEERRKLRDTQKSLHLLLKPEISKLCEILQLPGDVKGMAGTFLEYIMNNHHVNREPVTIFQAFQISLCWTAASLLKHKIDRKESLARAKQLLNFDCKEEEADFIYSKLRALKKMFSRHIENIRDSNSPEDTALRVKDVVRASQSTTSGLEELEEGEIRESSQSRNCSNQQVSAKQGQATNSENASGSLENHISKAIRRTLKICAKRMKKLLRKQQEEVQEFNEIREKEKARLEKEHKLELVLIRTIHNQNSVGLDKLKIVEQDHARKMEEHYRRWEIQKKDLEILQLAARTEEKQMKAHWLEQAKSGKSVESFANLPLPDSGFRLEQMVTNGQGTTPMSGPSSVKLDPIGTAPIIPGGVVLSEVLETVPNEAEKDNGPIEMVTLDMQSDKEDNGTDASLDLQFNRDDNGRDTATLERETITRVEQPNREGSSRGGDSPSLAQPHITPCWNSPLPSHEVPLNEPPELPMSAGVQEEDVPSCYVQNTPQLVEVPLLQQDDAVPSDQSNRETSVTQPLLQLLPSSSAGPQLAEHNQPDVPSPTGIQCELSNEQHISYLQAQVPTQPPMEDPAEPSHHSVPQPLQPLVDDSAEPSNSVSQSATHLPLRLPMDMPSGGSGTCVPDPRSLGSNPESSNCPQIVHSGGSGIRVSQTRSTFMIPEPSNHPPPAPVTSQMSQSWYPDPLHYEMERIQKEGEQTIKIHGEMKLRLESERDKEIEEIQRKYTALLQDAETALVQKRKTLEANYNQVFMNRMLAEAFRSKCSDPRVIGSPGQHLGPPSSFMHQLFQLSSQQHAQRPAPAAGPPAAPPVQVVHHSSALFSSNPNRPRLSPIVPPAGNLQGASEPRAPAPHLQPFRPATSISAANLQPLTRALPSQQSLSNTASSSMLPHLNPRTPTHSSGPFSRTQQAESVGVLPVFHNHTMSAMELLMDFDNRPGANPPNPLSTLQELEINLDAWDPSELAMSGSTRGNAVRTGPVADVVCLSDDD